MRGLPARDGRVVRAADVSRPARPPWSRYAPSALLDRLVSEPLETTDPLPIGDRRVEGLEFDARVVQVVLDALGAEALLGARRVGEQLGGIAQVRRNARGIRAISVSLEDRLELELVLDAVQAARDEC